MNSQDRVVSPDEVGDLNSQLMMFTSVSNEEENLNTDATQISEMTSNENLVGISQIMHPVVQQECKEASIDVELHVCDRCNRTFKQKSRYERHIANHPNEQSYLCAICNKTFSRMAHLEKHARAHTEERNHVCNTCGAAFILPHHLVRHMLIHSGARPFECSICNKQFTRKAGLTQHQYVHTGARPFVCHIHNCGKQFTDRTTHRRHMLTHSCEKPFICKECDKTFRTKSACRKHYLRHFRGTESYKCGICEEMFLSENEFQKHNEVHEQKQKIGIFRCGFCLRVFKSQDDLNKHVPLHESGLVHSCNHCSAKFYTESDLASHVEKHLDNTLPINPVKKVSLPLELYQPEHPDCEMKSETAITNSTPVNEPGKVVVVLQLPANSTMKNSDGILQVRNIQELLGNAQIDKLLVTTEKVSDSTTSLSVELSQNQQQGLQQILQTTNVNLVQDYLKCSEITDSVNFNRSSDVVPPVGLCDKVPVSSTLLVEPPSFVLSSVQQEQSSSYIIVPSPLKDNSCTVSATNSTLVNGAIFSATNSSPRKLLGESVFTTSKTDSHRSITVEGIAQNNISIKENSAIQRHESMLKTADIESQGPSSTNYTVQASDSQKHFDDIELCERQVKTPTLFGGEFENHLCGSNILEDTSFPIPSST